VNRYTVDDIKRETARAFKPLRCEVQDFDYDSGFELLTACNPDAIFEPFFSAKQALQNRSRLWSAIPTTSDPSVPPMHDANRV
jgi:hypothetical protein